MLTDIQKEQLKETQKVFNEAKTKGRKNYLIKLLKANYIKCTIDEDLEVFKTFAQNNKIKLPLRNEKRF